MRFLRVKQFSHLLGAFLRDESAGTAIEYGLICALIFLAVVTAVVNMSDKLIHNFWEPTAKAMPG